VCSVVKMAFIDASYRYYDFTWNSAYALFFGLLEATIGIMTASLPALNVILVRFVPDKLRTVQRSTMANQSGGTTARSRKTVSGQTQHGAKNSLSMTHSRKGSGLSNSSEKAIISIDEALNMHSGDPAVKHAYHSTISRLTEEYDEESHVGPEKLGTEYSNPIGQAPAPTHQASRPATTIDEFWDDYYGDIVSDIPALSSSHNPHEASSLIGVAGPSSSPSAGNTHPSFSRPISRPAPARNSSSGVLAAEFAEAMRRAKFEHDNGLNHASPTYTFNEDESPYPHFDADDEDAVIPGGLAPRIDRKSMYSFQSGASASALHNVSPPMPQLKEQPSTPEHLLAPSISAVTTPVTAANHGHQQQQQQPQQPLGLAIVPELTRSERAAEDAEAMILRR
jgi:hypothetical protein